MRTITRWLIATISAFTAAGTAYADVKLADVIQAGRRDAARKMIASGARVNEAQADGTTPLDWAVYNLDIDLVKALIARGADPNITNNFGSNPLAEAARAGNLTLVKILLDAHANVNAANADGQTALMLAARTGVVDIARLLVRHGADVNAREHWRGQTALMWAAAEDHPQITRYLISRGAAVNVRSTNNDWLDRSSQITSEPRAQYRPAGGLTPLLYAIRGDCLGCVQALVMGGADVNMPTPMGITPLISALDNFRFDIAKYLLERGANPRTRDWWGRTPLYVAIDMHSFVLPHSGTGLEPPGDRKAALDIAKMLLAAGADPNPQLNMHRPGRGGTTGRFTDDTLTTGATPLLCAAISHDNEALTLLLSYGAVVDLPNVMGVTPLMAAAGMGVQGGGTGVTLPDPHGNYAGDVQSRVLSTLGLLLRAGADVNARVTDTSSWTARSGRLSTMTKRQGQTALYGAIQWGWTRVVQYLLAHGAKGDVSDAEGVTPLEAAKAAGGGRDPELIKAIVAMIDKANENSPAGSKRPETVGKIVPASAVL